MMSGSGGGSGSAPQNFLPPGQAEVAGQLPGLVGPMRDQGVNALNALNGVSPAQSAYPFVQGATSNILNNPFQGDAIAGGTTARDIFQNQILPAGFGGADQLGQLAAMAQGQYGGAIGAANNPAYGAASDVGGRLSGPFQGAVGQALGDVFAPQYRQAIGYGNQAAPQLAGAASSILQTGFDPQHQLYDRTLQQVMDQQNAINSQSGIASTPYGAGIAGDRASNFALDWQDRQLGRQTSAGSAAAGLDQAAINSIINPSVAATSAAATDIGAAGNALSSALGGFLTPANAGVAAQLEGSGALGNLGRLVSSGATGQLGILDNLASSAPGFMGAPYTASNTIQGNNFGALQNEIALGNQNYLLPEQTISNLEQYLGLGQQASQIAQGIASTNNQIGATNFNQLSSGLGGASQLAFGSQGPFGSGGLFGGGGLGGLFGGGGANSVAIDAAGAAVPFGSDAAVGAFGGIDAALAPLAFSA